MGHFPSGQLSNGNQLQHLEVGRAESSRERAWFLRLSQAALILWDANNNACAIS